MFKLMLCTEDKRKQIMAEIDSISEKTSEEVFFYSERVNNKLKGFL